MKGAKGIALVELSDGHGDLLRCGSPLDLPNLPIKPRLLTALSQERVIGLRLRALLASAIAGSPA
jgi:hypothetical protein